MSANILISKPEGVTLINGDMMTSSIPKQLSKDVEMEFLAQNLYIKTEHRIWQVHIQLSSIDNVRTRRT